MLEENLISISEIEGTFKTFLTKDNKRVFFSGKFGIGKTYFLKEFFKNNLEGYEVFHLFPINYQINNNEDIIELLKYDILIELLKKNQSAFEGNEINGFSGWFSIFLSFLKDKGSNAFLQSFVGTSSNLLEISSDPVMKLISKLGRPMQDLLKFDSEFQKFKKEYKAGDKGMVEKFVSELNKKNISENDYLSYLLSNKILELKEKKQSVLILDDMDRMDPEHIFRILNVFSAHFDEEGNKFGFDHVIVVGDIKNIKSIFHHKYGERTDFEGYINKFFTIKPYYLDNKKIISERIPELVKQIKCEDLEIKKSLESSGIIKYLLVEILSSTLLVDKLTLRHLYKPLTHNFQELGNGDYGRSPFRDNFQQMIDIGIKLLIAIFGGDKEVFVSILEKIKASISNKNKANIPYKSYIGSMIKSLIEIKPGVKMSWKNHFFTAPIDSSTQFFEIDGSENEQAIFFYDVLIEYIKQSKYIKSNIWEYEK